MQELREVVYEFKTRYGKGIRITNNEITGTSVSTKTFRI